MRRWITIAMEDWRTTWRRRLLAWKVRAQNPGLNADPTVIWDYPFAHPECIEIEATAHVLQHVEILVYPTSPRSDVPGKLRLLDGAIISRGADVRAAGGTVTIGRNSCIAQHCVVVAANHLPSRDGHLIARWDEVRTGVELGDNVWVGALSVLLPGTRIGHNAIVAAGSVVRGEIPDGELWGGVPARFIRRLEL